MDQTPKKIVRGYDRDLAYRSVGPGWRPLVAAIYDFIEVHDQTVEVLQVKEKFGGLRFYVRESQNPQTREVISKAESASYTTCDRCGAPGSIHNSSGNWVKTRCARCGSL